MKSGDLLGLPLEMKPGQFIDKLNPTDRNNMTRLMGGLIESLSGQGMHGAIIGVGGVLTKPAPRKDVDYVIMLHMPQSNVTDYDRAVQCMDLLVPFVRKTVDASDNQFQISTIVPPKLDIDYGREYGLLKDAGDIQIQPTKGTLIDLIPRNEASLEKYTQRQTDPLAVLETF